MSASEWLTRYALTRSLSSCPRKYTQPGHICFIKILRLKQQSLVVPGHRPGPKHASFQESLCFYDCSLFWLQVYYIGCGSRYLYDLSVFSFYGTLNPQRSREEVISAHFAFVIDSCGDCRRKICSAPLGCLACVL